MKKQRLVLDELSVETFDAGKMELPQFNEMQTHATGIDSTCPCCDLTFGC